MNATMHLDNNRKRPSLSEQINRLDKTLDGLSDALNGAVADAVKDAVGHAVREAVQAVLNEVLSRPEVIAKLAPAVASEPKPQEPSRLRKLLGQVWTGICGCIAAIRLACGLGAQKVWTKLGNGWQRTKECAQVTWSNCQILGYFKYQIMLALGMGIATGIAVWYASPWIGAVLSGIGGFATTVAVQGWLWVRKLVAVNAETA
jgi:hypothetical protein